MSVVNLFELSRNFSNRGQAWLMEKYIQQQEPVANTHGVVPHTPVPTVTNASRGNSGIQQPEKSSLMNSNQSQIHSLRDPRELDMDLEMEWFVHVQNYFITNKQLSLNEKAQNKVIKLGICVELKRKIISRKIVQLKIWITWRLGLLLKSSTYKCCRLWIKKNVLWAITYDIHMIISLMLSTMKSIF